MVVVDCVVLCVVRMGFVPGGPIGCNGCDGPNVEPVIVVVVLVVVVVLFCCLSTPSTGLGYATSLFLENTPFHD